VRHEDGDYPCDAISVFVGSRALWAAKDAENATEFNEYARLFPGLANRSVGRKFCWLDGSTRATPQLGLAVLYQQDLVVLIARYDCYRRNKQELVANALS
jgi:hypothetical protein